MGKEKIKLGVFFDEIKGEVLINFKKEFYEESCILKAIEDFKGVCISKVEESDKNIRILLKARNLEEVRIVGYEFPNYVLALMKNMAVV